MSKGRGRPVLKVELTPPERDYLESLSRRRNALAREVERAKIVILASEDWSNKRIAERFDLKAHMVGYWRKRFAKGGIVALSELPLSGRPRTITDEQVAEIVRLTLEEKTDCATHWSNRKMAERTGLSQTSVSKIRLAFKLQPIAARASPCPKIHTLWKKCRMLSAFT